jgi:hypothetical protein
MGRNDASYGLVQLGDGHGNFKSVKAINSGFSSNGEIRSLKKITVGASVYYIAIRNNNSVTTFGLGPMRSAM